MREERIIVRLVLACNTGCPPLRHASRTALEAPRVAFPEHQARSHHHTPRWAAASRHDAASLVWRPPSPSSGVSLIARSPARRIGPQCGSST